MGEVRLAVELEVAEGVTWEGVEEEELELEEAGRVTETSKT